MNGGFDMLVETVPHEEIDSDSRTLAATDPGNREQSADGEKDPDQSRREKVSSWPFFM